MSVASEIPEGEVLYRRYGAPDGSQPASAFVAVGGELKGVPPERSAPGLVPFPKVAPDGGGSGSEQVAGVVDGRKTDTWIDGVHRYNCGGNEWQIAKHRRDREAQCVRCWCSTACAPGDDPLGREDDPVPQKVFNAGDMDIITPLAEGFDSAGLDFVCHLVQDDELVARIHAE